MLYALVAAIICWGVTLAFLFVQNNAHWLRVYKLIGAAREERDDLLDRLMARDFVQLKQVTALEKQIEKLEPSRDELEELVDFDLSDVGN